jgi:pimeloyl-ACP methyl ester carboxylesterase
MNALEPRAKRRRAAPRGLQSTNAGHWPMKEQPAQTIALIRDFLGAN